MNMKNFFCVLLLLLVCLPALAGPRTASDALNVATNHLRESAPRHANGAPHQAPQLTLAMAAENAADHKVDYYVFNNSGNRGFVIVSGDDNAAPVLGYCDEGTIEPDNMPDGLRYMLSCYAEQMRYLRSHPASAYAPASTETTMCISPLLTTNWNQNTPFNDLCPTFGPDNTRSMTGCVATATAQVMNYHQWPKQGTGEFTYVCNVNKQGDQTLSADFGATTYDWDNMLDNYYVGGYNEAEGKAIATLLYHVGVASHMNYGITSNTPTFAALEALRTYFKYNKGMKVYTRTNVLTAQWDSLLMNELINARPVIYTGFSPEGGGHCFVLDGCNADGYYHFNWGWGGRSNGYFLLTSLNPRDQGIGSYEGGYNASQEFIANVYPDKGEPFPDGYLEATCYKIWPEEARVNLGEKVPINIRYLLFNADGYGLSVNVSFGFMLSDKNGIPVDFADENIKANSNYILGTRYSWIGYNAFQFTTPTNLADGEYNLWLMYKEESQDSYSYLNNIPHLPGFLKVYVSDGVMTLSVPETEHNDLSVTALTAPERVGTNNEVEVSATIANASDEYYDNVYLSLYRDGTQIEIFEGIGINVSPGGIVSFKTRITAPDTPGTYELAVLNKDLNRLSGGSVTMTVVASANYDLSIATQLQVNSYYMEMDNVGGTAVVSNSGTGDYVGPIPFMILNSDASRIMAHGNSPIVTIPAGGSATVNINTAYEGIPGQVYKMCLRKVTSPNSNTIWGNQVPFEVNSLTSTSLLGNIVGNGVENGEYLIADHLTIVDTHGRSLFVTNGNGSWIEVKCGDFFDQVKDMKAFKAGTLRGKYSNESGNPSLTLTCLPVAGMVLPVTAVKVDLGQNFTLEPDMVIDFTGYYAAIEGKDFICEHDGSTGDYGQSLPIAFDWLSTPAALTKGACYDLHGVARLSLDTNETPSRMAEEEATASYTIYLTKAPTDDITAVGDIDSDAVKVSATAGTITVTGAKHVAVYNMAGALAGRGNEVHVSAGIYVVIADGLMRKVVVR